MRKEQNWGSTGIPFRLLWLRCLISCLFKSFSGVLMFILGHTPSFFMLLCLASYFLGFLVLARILPLSRYSPRTFSDTRPGIYPFSVLAHNLLFSGICLNSTIFQYLLGYDLFFGTIPNTIFFVLDSPILTQIRSPVCLVFSGTRPDTISSSVLA